jgi:hypothetical protein
MYQDINIAERASESSSGKLAVKWGGGGGGSAIGGTPCNKFISYTLQYDWLLYHKNSGLPAYIYGSTSQSGLGIPVFQGNEFCMHFPSQWIR